MFEDLKEQEQGIENTVESDQREFSLPTVDESSFLGQEREYPPLDEIKNEVEARGEVVITTGWTPTEPEIDFGGGVPQFPVGQAQTSSITVEDGQVYKDDEPVTGQEAEDLLKQAYHEIESQRIQAAILEFLETPEPLF